MLQQFVRILALGLFMGIVSVAAVNAQTVSNTDCPTGPALATLEGGDGGDVKVVFNESQLKKVYGENVAAQKKNRSLGVQSMSSYKEQLNTQIQEKAKQVFPRGVPSGLIVIVIITKGPVIVIIIR